MVVRNVLTCVNIVLIGVYLVARNRGDFKRIAVVQPAITVVSIVIAASSFWQPGAQPGFTAWILAGLGLSLIGDIINVDMSSQKVLITGLVIFVFAYLTYALGLTIWNGFQPQDLWVAAVLLVIYAIEMWFLWPGLGELKIPVLVYGLVLPTLVNRAVSTFFGTTFSLTQAILLTAGAAMVYTGDLEYGIHRFRRPLPFTLGPVLYAGGQLLIALSPSYFT